MTRVIMVLALAIAGLASAARAEPPLPSGRFRVGGADIMCVKAPCPRIGIMKVDSPEGKPGRPIYSGPRPPRIEGDAAAKAAVERSWSIQGCLEIEGAFLQPAVFEVRRVYGPCGR